MSLSLSLGFLGSRGWAITGLVGLWGAAQQLYKTIVVLYIKNLTLQIFWSHNLDNYHVQLIIIFHHQGDKFH